MRQSREGKSAAEDGKLVVPCEYAPLLLEDDYRQRCPADWAVMQQEACDEDPVALDVPVPTRAIRLRLGKKLLCFDYQTVRDLLRTENPFEPTSRTPFSADLQTQLRQQADELERQETDLWIQEMRERIAQRRAQRPLEHKSRAGSSSSSRAGSGPARSRSSPCRWLATNVECIQNPMCYWGRGHCRQSRGLH